MRGWHGVTFSCPDFFLPRQSRKGSFHWLRSGQSSLHFSLLQINECLRNHLETYYSSWNFSLWAYLKVSWLLKPTWSTNSAFLKAVYLTLCLMADKSEESKGKSSLAHASEAERSQGTANFAGTHETDADVLDLLDGICYNLPRCVLRCFLCMTFVKYISSYVVYTFQLSFNVKVQESIFLSCNGTSAYVSV